MAANKKAILVSVCVGVAVALGTIALFGKPSTWLSGDQITQEPPQAPAAFTETPAMFPAEGTAPTPEAPFAIDPAPAESNATPEDVAPAPISDIPPTADMPPAENIQPENIPTIEPANPAPMPSQDEPAIVPQDLGQTVIPHNPNMPICNYDHLNGMNAADVEKALKETKRPYRIIKPGQPVTMDLRPERINVELNDQGTVMRVYCA